MTTLMSGPARPLVVARGYVALTVGVPGRSRIVVAVLDGSGVAGRPYASSSSQPVSRHRTAPPTSNRGRPQPHSSTTVPSGMAKPVSQSG